VWLWLLAVAGSALGALALAVSTALACAGFSHFSTSYLLCLFWVSSNILSISATAFSRWAGSSDRIM
jgi:hypothetical protein